MHDDLIALRLYRLNNPNELTPIQFRKLEIEIKHSKSNIVSDEYADFKLWYNGYLSRQHYFKNFLLERFGSLSKISLKKVVNILEVGCGRTAQLSKLLSNDGFCVTCIDPKLEVNDCTNLKTIKGEFNYETFDLTGFDCVIALEPCDATEHIIRACINQNVPFIILLCSIPHSLISGEKPNDVFKWYSFLLSIAPRKIDLELIDIMPLFKTYVISYLNSFEKTFYHT